MRVALRPNGAPPRRERTACRCLAVAIARSKDPSACIVSDETFSKAEPYGIMPRREAAPFKAITDRVSVDYTEARRSRRSTGNGSNRRSRPTTSISTRRCHLSCATRLHISQTAGIQRATPVGECSRCNIQRIKSPRMLGANSRLAERDHSAPETSAHR